jgi:hypothetical protein
MDQNRLGPLEKPLRMTDMSVKYSKGEKKKRITKRKDPKTIEKIKNRKNEGVWSHRY